jgi:hypothetical protein
VARSGITDQPPRESSAFMFCAGIWEVFLPVACLAVDGVKALWGCAA